MTGRLGRGHSVADQCEGGAQLLVVELWSAGVPSLRAGSSHAVAGSLGDQPSLEFWNEIDRPLECFPSSPYQPFQSKSFRLSLAGIMGQMTSEPHKWIDLRQCIATAHTNC